MNTPDLAQRAAVKLERECRAFPVRLEVRSTSAPSTASLEGYASVVDEPYEMYDWLGTYGEVVRPGAFTKTLSESAPVQLLVNHGGLSMAYTKAGTLRLAEDTTGLHIAADVNTDRTDVADMVHALADGAVDEMSFAFRVTRQMWSPDYDQRDILEVDMHKGDVSVVNFGANPATSVALRAAAFADLDDRTARALLERLEARLRPAGVPVQRSAPDDDPAAPAGGRPLTLAAAQLALAARR